MRTRNVWGHVILTSVVLLFILAGCGWKASGTLTASDDEFQYEQLGPYAIAVTCDGADCGDSVSSAAVVGIKTIPAIDPDLLGASIACGDSEYTLTLSSEVHTEELSELGYTHDQLPAITDCTIDVQLLSAAKDYSYLGEGATIEVPFTTMCSTIDDFSNEKTVECWTFALMQVERDGGRPAQQGQFQFGMGVKAPASTSMMVVTDLDTIRDLGFTIEADAITRSLMIKGPTDLSGFLLAAYKKFESRPTIEADMEHTGMFFQEDGMNRGTYTANEGAAFFVGDNKEIHKTCSLVMNQAGVLISSLVSGGSSKCSGYIDFLGINMVGLESQMAQKACGIDSNTDDYNAKILERHQHMKQGIVSAESCEVETAGEMKFEIKNGWKMKTDSEVHAFKPNKDEPYVYEMPTVDFGATEDADGYSAGFVYVSNVPAGTKKVGGGGKVDLPTKEVAPLDEYVEPYTAMIKGFSFGGAKAIGQE